MSERFLTSSVFPDANRIVLLSFPLMSGLAAQFPVEAVMCIGAPLIEDRILQFLLGRTLSKSKQVGTSAADPGSHAVLPQIL